GLVKYATTSVVTLDHPTVVSTGDKLSVVLPDGTMQSRNITGVDASDPDRDGYDILTISPALPSASVTGANWSIDSTELVAQYFRVVSVKEGDGIEYGISAVAHHPDKHAAIDTGARLDPLPI